MDRRVCVLFWEVRRQWLVCAVVLLPLCGNSCSAAYTHDDTVSREFRLAFGARRVNARLHAIAVPQGHGQNNRSCFHGPSVASEL